MVSAHWQAVVRNSTAADTRDDGDAAKATTPKDIFLESVNRCTACEQFIPSFYDRFLSSSAAVREKFRFTDFAAQNAMLARSLELCAGATCGDQDALHEMHDRATTHDRDHLNIQPSLYDNWLEAIIATAAEYDPEWHAGVENAWRRILGHVIDHMTRAY